MHLKNECPDLTTSQAWFRRSTIVIRVPCRSPHTFQGRSRGGGGGGGDNCPSSLFQEKQELVYIFRKTFPTFERYSYEARPYFRETHVHAELSREVR